MLAAIGKWAKASLAPQTRLLSDGLGGFAAVAAVGCLHVPIVVGNRKPRDLPRFKWVNTALGNLKTTLAGAFHSLKYRKYAEHCLAAFAYRFNRRSQPPARHRLAQRRPALGNARVSRLGICRCLARRAAVHQRPS